MARSETDAWDLGSGVGGTATMVAAARAAATRRAVIDDPFPEPLVRAVGLDFFTTVAEGEADLADIGDDAWFRRVIGVFAARTRYYDEFFVVLRGRASAKS
jgi:O-methyltransferase involved in polyketide biosynthesis